MVQSIDITRVVTTLSEIVNLKNLTAGRKHILKRKPSSIRTPHLYELLVKDIQDYYVVLYKHDLKLINVL